MKKRVFLLSSLFFLLFACQQNENKDNVSKVSPYLTFKTGESNTGSQPNSIGVYAISASTGDYIAENTEFIKTNGIYSSADNILIPESVSELYFHTYAPYVVEVYDIASENIIFTLPADQSTQQGFANSDFSQSSKITSNFSENIALDFNHLMSQVDL